MRRKLIQISLSLAVIFSAALVGGCKVTQAESTARSMSRDQDLLRSPYQFKVDENKEAILRVLRKMPLGETAADGVLRADIEKILWDRIGATAKVSEIRIFETHASFRREVWVVDHAGKQFAFDIHLSPKRAGGVNVTVEGPVEIHGSL